MTEGSGAMTGGSIGVWAIAIVILLAMFGGGNGFFENLYQIFLKVLIRISLLLSHYKEE